MATAEAPLPAFHWMKEVMGQVQCQEVWRFTLPSVTETTQSHGEVQGGARVEATINHPRMFALLRSGCEMVEHTAHTFKITLFLH